MPPRKHAQETRTMQKARATASPMMSVIRETAPLALLLAIAFGGSCNNIFRVFGACGTTGIFQYGDTAAPDLLCLVAFNEIIRDHRLKRDHKGWLSWPIVIVLFGIGLTLTLGYIGNDKPLLAQISHSWTGHLLGGPLPGLLLLLALSVFHRRDTGTATAGTGTGRRRGQASTAASTAAKTTEAAASTAAPVPSPAAPVLPVVPAASTGTGEGSGLGDDAQPPAERSWDTLLAEARTYRDELADRGEGISKDKIRLRLKVANSTALELARVVKAETAEAAGQDEAVV